MTRLIGLVAVMLVTDLLGANWRYQEDKVRQLDAWGEVVNPDGDGEFQLEGPKLRIRVPGPWHDLMHGRKMNAPRVLRAVNGDFVAQVRVAGTVRPSGKVTQAPTFPFNGAGLLLWQDADNYGRIERAAIIKEGVLSPCLLLEAVQKGKAARSDGFTIADNPIYLRLERRQGSVYAGASTDELRWQYMKPLRADFSGQWRIGVAAINNTDQAFTAELDGFGVFQKTTEGTR